MNIYVILSSFISALMGAMGFGGGTVLIIYLTSLKALEQKQAQGINLIFFLATGLVALIFNAKKGLIDLKALKKLLLLSLPGLLVGYTLLPLIPSELLKKLFGTLLIILGLKALLSKKKKTASSS